MKPKMTNELKALLQEWESSGRVYFVYPNKGYVSLNGHRLMSYANAEKYLNGLKEIIEVDSKILEVMKERLAQPEFVGPRLPESLIDRD